MAHQTGIKANAAVSQAFTEALAAGSKCRFLKLVIEGESLELDDRQEVKGDWRQQYDQCVRPHLTEKAACYMLYRLDSSNAHGYNWLFLQYVHDFAPVREKMLYSATAATVKQTFGTEHFATAGSLTGTQPEDLTLQGYERHLASVAAPPPLTMAEEEKALVRDMERKQVGVDERQQTLAGLGFQVDEQLTLALRQFSLGELDYVQAEIVLKPKEQLQLSSSYPRLAANQLAQQVPDSSPRYHLYRCRHQYEGQQYASVIFIYSTPGYKCPIKERMVYSSGKGFFVQYCSSVGIEPERRLEVDSAEEVSEPALMLELHPAPVEQQQQQKFSKPKPPGRRPGNRK